MKKHVPVLVIGIVFITLFAMFIYPTRYHYQELHKWDKFENQTNTYIRTNNFTGKVDVYDEERGKW